MAAVIPYGGDPHDFKVFTLPVTGAVRVYGPEMEVIRTPEFQRLAGLRQLGTAHVVFRGAVHTRFEHSLGVLAQAQRLVDAVNRNPSTAETIGDRGLQLVRMVALLHDLTHIPFGHTLEDEFGLLQRHDSNVPRFRRLLVDSAIGQVLRRWLGDEGFQDCVAALTTTADDQIAGLRFPYVADIVGNTVCADMLDYVTRDLHACGLPCGLGERFLDFFAITSSDLPDVVHRRRMVLSLDKSGIPRPDVESEVIKLLSYRYELAERVYFHHAKNAASAMIARAAQAAGVVSDDPTDDDSHLDWLGDETLLLGLSNPQLGKLLGLHRHPRDTAELRLAADLADEVRRRSLYKIGYLGVYDDLAEQAENLHALYGDRRSRRHLEDRLATDAGLTPGHVLVHLPSPRMLLKLAGVRVLTHDGQVTTLEKWDSDHSRRAQALIDAHRRLWRVAVYVHPTLTPQQRSAVRAASEEHFMAPSRYTK